MARIENSGDATRMIPNEAANISVEKRETLVRQSNAADCSTLQELLKICESALLHTSLRITRNYADAEDVRQEAMLKALLHFDRFEGRSRFTTWMTRITINEGLMLLRSRRPHQHVSLDQMLDARDPRVVCRRTEKVDGFPERQYANSELREALVAEIWNLSPNSRVVFVMQAIEHKSVTQIAQLLRISASAVKTRLRRARLELRKRLAGSAWRTAANCRTSTAPQCSQPEECMAS